MPSRDADRNDGDRRPAEAADEAVAADVTALLARARSGDRGASDELFQQVYGQLHRLARAQLAVGGRAGSTLDTTALVHEAYLRMVDGPALEAADRAHFFNLAARVMRHLIVDAFRRRGAAKRGDPNRLELDSVQLPAGVDPRLSAELLSLDVALDALEASSPDLARLVELRFFAGLPLPEISSILSRSERTLKRDWRRARAFLLMQLGAPPPEGAPAGT